MAVKVENESSAVRALRIEQEKLALLYGKLQKTEGEIEKAKRTLERISDAMGTAELSGDDRASLKLREQAVQVQQDLQGYKESERALRKVISQQDGRVRELAGPAKREAAKVAIQRWLDLLDRLESFSRSEDCTILHQTLVDALHEDHLTVGREHGAWRPTDPEMIRIRRVTDEHIARLERQGYSFRRGSNA
jgi:hypothetical protein